MTSRRPVDIGPVASDVVVGISASDRTPYVVAALEAAAPAGALTSALVNNLESELSRLADLTVEVPTGRAGTDRKGAGLVKEMEAPPAAAATPGDPL